jgi:hypothetical protein
MSATTVRKLGRISDGAKDTSYFLMPPKYWLDAEEKNAGKKILHFAIKSEAYALVLSPIFDSSQVEQPRNSTPEEIMLLLKQGTLYSKLRETRKGNNVYRIVNIPRVWVRAREQGQNRQVTALSLTTEPTRILVEPIFGNKMKQH